MTTTINRTLASLGVLAMLALAIPAFAAEPNWELNDDTKIVFFCYSTYWTHTLDTVNQDENGLFTGTGTWDDSPLTHKWDISGQIDGDNITYTITYTGVVPGVYTNTGVIHSDGSISGTSNNGCDTFSSPVGTATEIEDEPDFVVPTTKEECKKGGWTELADRNGTPFKNQGQCVSYVAADKGSR